MSLIGKKETIKIRIQDKSPDLVAEWCKKYYYGPQFKLVRKATIDNVTRYSISGSIIFPIVQPGFVEPTYYTHDLENQEIGFIEVDNTTKKIENRTGLTEFKNELTKIRKDSLDNFAAIILRYSDVRVNSFYMFKLKTSPLRKILQLLIVNEHINLENYDPNHQIHQYLSFLLELGILLISPNNLNRIKKGSLFINTIKSLEGTEEGEFFRDITDALIKALLIYITKNVDVIETPIRKLLGTHFDILSIYYEYCILNKGIVAVNIELIFDYFQISRQYRPRLWESFIEYIIELHEAEIIIFKISDQSIIGSKNTFDQIYKALIEQYSNLEQLLQRKTVPLWRRI